MRRIAVLGSTGSVGTQALDVISRFPEEFKVVSLTAGGNTALFEAQLRKFRPKFAYLAHPPAGYAPPKLEGVTWVSGVDETLEGADTALNAIIGFAGLTASMAAIKRGIRLCLANKETLVAGGELVTAAALAYGCDILPVDSEHCAIHQCLCGQGAFSRLILTASGGPFRDWPLERMRGATPEQALCHPNWSMGRRITVDSATMMNKALELVEAKYLFGAEANQVEALVHPEQIIHSLAEYPDGIVIAQMGIVDMRLPIGYTLWYPNRIDMGMAKLDFAALGALTFRKPDETRFPALAVAREVMRAGGTCGAIMNAADEAAVDIFLNGGCGFLDIVDAVRYALDTVPQVAQPEFSQIFDADRRAREAAIKYLSGR